MHRLAGTPSILVVLALMYVQPSHSQALTAAVAGGPLFLPGSGARSDWQGLVGLQFYQGNGGVRIEGMLAGVPGADLLALTANYVWTFRRREVNAVEPYLLAGVGTYVKFHENHFGLNGGAGVRRWVGPVRLFAEARYHRVLSRFDEQGDANTFVPLSFGIMLGR